MLPNGTTGSSETDKKYENDTGPSKSNCEKVPTLVSYSSLSTNDASDTLKTEEGGSASNYEFPDSTRHEKEI